MKEQKERIAFEARITFEGGVEEFQRLGQALVDLGVGCNPPDWPPGHAAAGCWVVPIWEAIGRPYMEQLVKEAPTFKMPEFIPKTIPGGIRVAHVHLPSDEIALLDGGQFADLAGRVAAVVVKRLGDTPDYVQVTSAMRELAGKGRTAR